ncbi:hypothetical protein BDZ89DRAFT_1131343 [Hymenopellis radicata]|nr:hypothetical protein BDZ89DRAFT_1131343 [Hymenopellis radicata]
MDDKENQPLVPAPVKRGRKRRTVARRDGVGLSDLPFDVLLEIGSLLLPLDLLNLGRVNRVLRGALMSKGSRTAWKAARANADNLPEPFNGMSEPAWAQLVYVRICQFCWTTAVKDPDFNLFCRMCSTCAVHHLVMRDPNVDDPVFSVIPLLYTRCALQRTYDETKLAMEKLSDPTDFIAAKKAEQSAAKAHTRLCQEWMNLLRTKRAQELEDAKRTRFNQICDRLRTLGYGEELTFMTEVQHNTLLERLTAHHFVRQTRPLTDRIWANISGSLTTFMNTARTQRLAYRERLALSRKDVAVFYLRMLKEDEPTSFSWVHLPYFLSFPPVKAIINRADYNDVCSHVFDEDLAPIKACAAELSVTLDVQLVSVIDRGRSGPPLSMSHVDIRARLQLATSGVICTKCSRLPADISVVDRDTSNERSTLAFHPLFYPETLVHSCALGTDPLDSGGVRSHPKDGDVVRIADCGRRQRTELRFELYQKHPVLTWLVEMVVIVAGMDPTTATVTQMDKSAPLFECQSCVADKKRFGPVVKRLLYSWRKIVCHVLSEHIGIVFTSANHFAKHVTPVRKRDFSEEWVIQRTFSEAIRYHCKFCRDKPSEKLGGYTRMELDDHFICAHDYELDDALEDEDYVKIFGAPEKPRHTIVHLTRKIPQQRRT